MNFEKQEEGLEEFDNTPILISEELLSFADEQIDKAANALKYDLPAPPPILNNKM